MKLDIEAELKRMEKRFASALGGGETDACYVQALTRLKRIGELMRRTAANKRLGWQPSTDFREILRLCGRESE